MGRNIPDILLYLKDEKTSDIIKEAYNRLMPFDSDDYVYLGGARMHLKRHLEEKVKEYVDDFDQCLESYRIGFTSGYFDFNFYLVELMEKDYVDKDRKEVIFEFIHDIPIFQFDPRSIVGLSSVYVGYELIDFGKSNGYLYKAWEIIFKNQDVFEPLFKEPRITKTPKKKEVTPFADCLKHDHPDQLAQMLKDSFTEMKRPKQVALFILGLDVKKLLKTETIKRSELLKSIENYFELNSINPSALNRYINYNFKNDNVERHIDNDEIKKTAERIVLIKNRLL